MKSLKRSLINLTQTYLRNYPATSIISLSTSALRLGYTFSSPFTNSKSTYENYIPLNSGAQKHQTLINQPISQYLLFVQPTPDNKQPSRLQLSNSFDSVSNLPHQKLLQDSVFGKPIKARNAEKWVYIAKIKEDKETSLFNSQEMGTGKKIYQGDFGEEYDGVSKVGVFVWDIQKKKVLKLEIPEDVIPACPVFADSDGNKIIFHGYQRQQFAYGILHCFNRPVSIYEATYTTQEIQKQSETNGKKTMKKQLKAKTICSKLQLQSQKNFTTNIFPNISACGTYLTCFQGTGLTHTYYLDLVIHKQMDGKWVQTYRFKEKFIGYYDTFQSHFIEVEGKTYLFTQTIQDSCQKIYKVEMESGQLVDFSKNKQGSVYAIKESIKGMLLGVYTSHEQRCFFYTEAGKFQIKHLQPYKGQKYEGVNLKEMKEPIHAFLMQLDDSQVDEGYKHNLQKGKRPLIINIHGGPHGAIHPVITLERYLMLKAGYTILMPNATGFAGFGHQYLTCSLGKPGSANAEEMLKLLTKVLKEHQELSSQNVHLIGGSYGGYMSAYLGCHHPQHFKSSVILNGVLSIPGQLWYTDIPQWSSVQGCGHDNLESLTSQNYIQMFKESPISKPMRIPTLQILGAKDRRVPHRQGFLFEAIAKKAKTSIQTYVYENSGHSLMDSVETSVDVAMKIILFFEKENWKGKNKEDDEEESKQKQQEVMKEKQES